MRSIELPNEEKMMITRPTPDDVRHYEEFLRQRHPMLLEAIRRVEDELVRDSVDLEQLLRPMTGLRPARHQIERQTFPTSRVHR